MTWSRRALVVAIAVALTGSACSRFAPKADVGIREVALNLAFGVEVKDLVPPPPPTAFPTPTLELPTPTAVPTPAPPPPPEPDQCPPTNTSTARHGAAPPKIGNHDFEPGASTGGRPRTGDYFFYFQGNNSGEPVRDGFDYKTIGGLATSPGQQSFNFDVRDEIVGIDLSFEVFFSPDEGSGEAGSEAGAREGIYLQGIEVPFKEGSGERRFFPAASVRIAQFPLQSGRTSNDSQPVPSDPETDDGVPTLTGLGNVLEITTTVVGKDTIIVCEDLADAWKVNFVLELRGDADIRMTGTWWLATQYGGWPIQELYTIDGSTDYRSGNFFTRLSRLDPGDVA